MTWVRKEPTNNYVSCDTLVMRKIRWIERKDEWDFPYIRPYLPVSQFLLSTYQSTIISKQTTRTPRQLSQTITYNSPYKAHHIKQIQNGCRRILRKFTVAVCSANTIHSREWNGSYNPCNSRVQLHRFISHVNGVTAGLVIFTCLELSLTTNS